MSAKVTHKYIQANGIRLAYEEFGNASDPAVVLIMGLGMQLIAWPEQLCWGLADKGYRVIRFDNRDVGYSHKMEGVRAPGMAKMMLFPRLGLPLKAPYNLLDLTKDTLGLMDALGIEKAHVVGASMGGMIAQLAASDFPDRVISLVSMMSTSGARSLPKPRFAVVKQLVSRPPSTVDEQAYLDAMLKTAQVIGSPGSLFNESHARERVRNHFRRSYYPAGFYRQFAAVLASGDRVDRLKKISVPSLVMHGKADVLVPVEGGIDTARLIPNAKLELIEGWGHDLPLGLLPRFVELIADHMGAVEAEVA